MWINIVLKGGVIKIVKEVKIKNITYYQCEICKFYYKTKELAEKCEEFCEKYKSCSLEITKHAVQID